MSACIDRSRKPFPNQWHCLFHALVLCARSCSFIYSGTSAGSPQWAAITVLADQYNGHRLGFINAGIYRIGMSDFYSQVFHDTRVGTNTFTGTGSNGKSVTINGYNARVGWDACTGWGTPNAYNFVHIIGGYVHANDGQGF